MSLENKNKLKLFFVLLCSFFVVFMTADIAQEFSSMRKEIIVLKERTDQLQVMVGPMYLAYSEPIGHIKPLIQLTEKKKE